MNQILQRVREARHEYDEAIAAASCRKGRLLVELYGPDRVYVEFTDRNANRLAYAMLSVSEAHDLIAMLRGFTE